MAGFIPSLLKLLKGKPQIPASLQDNQLLQIILKRRSVRSFKANPIPEDVFQAILEAGRLAPSTVNLQSWSFGIFTAAEWRETFSKPIPFLAARAVIILGDTHRDRMVLDTFPEAPLVEYSLAVMNASLAAMNMNIAAEALGVSSVMLSETGRSGILDAAYLKEKLNLPERVFPLMTIVFGYAKTMPAAMPPKLPLEVVSFTGKYPETEIRVMRDWLDQTKAGYKAMRPLSSFEEQLDVYQDKIFQAEENLNRLVFGEKKEAE